MGLQTKTGRRAPAAADKARDARIALVRAEGVVERAGIEACDYLLSRAGDDVKGAVVDLSLATHLDYKAVVILVARRRVLRARGADLAVAAGLRDVRHILRAAAGAELPVFPTVEEAQAYVRGDAAMAVAAAPGRRSAAR